MHYRYSAYGKGGQPVAGTVEALTRDGALRQLNSQGLLVESLRPTTGVKLSWDMDLTSPKLSLGRQSLFFNQLSMLVSGGVPVLQSLQVLQELSTKPLKKILSEMADFVETGQPLSKAMAAHAHTFHPTAPHVVAVSELSGELGEGLKLLADQFDAEDQIQRKVVSAVTYPALVLTITLGIAIFMLTFIVPSYGEMFEDLGAQLPWQTRALLATAGFVINQWYVLAAVVLGIIIFVYAKKYLPKVHLWWDRLYLKIPVFGPMARNREAARYFRTLGTLLKSGVSVIIATQVAASVLENAALSQRLSAVPNRIAEGSTLGRAVKDTGVLPPIMAELLLVGEMIGSSDTTLLQLSTIADGEVKQTTDRLTSILEPALILLLAGVVLCVIVPLLLPMYDLYQAVQ